MSDEKLTFDLNPQQIKYRDILKKEFLELEIYAISDINPNRNKTHFTLESMKKALPDIKNKPIVGFFDKGDFEQHNGQISYDPEYKIQYWDTTYGERILGLIRESDPVEIVEKDGLHWIKFRCALWTSYCYKQVKRLLRDRKKKVSVEITVHQSETVNGIEDILDFTLNGVTILGSKNGKAILEAIPDAHLSILENLDEELLEDQKKVLSFAYNRIEDQSDNEEPDNNIETKNTKKEVYSEMNPQELEIRLSEDLASHTLKHGILVNKYTLEKIYDDHIVVRDDLVGERFKLLYEITTDGDVIIHYESAKSLKDVDDMVEKAEATYAAKEVGTGDDIIVDKSKDSISNRSWGDVDKSALRERVIKAGNFKTVARDIFLDLREGWEDGEVTKLKYPVMCLEGDKAVYNRGALAAAKAYAEKNDETKVLAKVHKIYKKLDLNEDEDEKEAASFVDEFYDCIVPEVKLMEETKVEIERAAETEPVEIENPVENSSCPAEPEKAEFAAEEASSKEYAAEKPEEEKEEPVEEEKSEGCVCESEACEEKKEEEACEKCECEKCECEAEQKCECDDCKEHEPDECNDGDCKEEDDDCGDCDEDYEEPAAEDEDKLCKLQTRCDELQAMCDAQAKEIEMLQAKCGQYADYEEIKARMQAAETKIFANECEKMKAFACGKMANEKINPSDRKEIEEKAAAGQYSSEEDIVKDIAIAIYKARPEQTERFSTEIPAPIKAAENVKKTMTRAERIAARCGK